MKKILLSFLTFISTPALAAATEMTADDKIAQGTFLLVLVTALLALSTIALWLATKKLFQGADDTARKQLRAYIGIDQIKFELPNLDEAKYTPVVMTPGNICSDFLSVEVKNFGPTPAFDVQVYIYWQTLPAGYGLPSNYFQRGNSNDIDEPDNREVRFITSKFMVFPGQTKISKTPLEDIRNLRETKKANGNIFVYGRIYYRDIYGRNWRTKFCEQWEYNHKSEARFVPYEEYNDEDDKKFE